MSKRIRVIARMAAVATMFVTVSVPLNAAASAAPAGIYVADSAVPATSPGQDDGVRISDGGVRIS